MQGFVCSNSIYVFLIEDIEQYLIGSCKENQESINDLQGLYDFHVNRIHNTLEQIAFYKKKQLKQEYSLQ